MRIYKVKAFARFSRREHISDAALIKAVSDAERGLIDADLSGGLIKQRVARAGEGKSGGYRTLIAIRSKERAIYLFGFAKSDLDNIADDVLSDLRQLAAYWLSVDDAALEKAVAAGHIIGVKANDKSKSKKDRRKR